MLVRNEAYTVWKLLKTFSKPLFTDTDGKPTAPAPLSRDHSHFRRKPRPNQLFNAFQNKLAYSIITPFTSEVFSATDHLISLYLQRHVYQK